MKTIKEIFKLAQKIERLPEVSEVAITEEKLIITLKDNVTWVIFQEKIKEITGDYPTPCDVNIKDWFVYY